MVETTLLYLARDKLYDVEKPFSAEFTIEEAEGVQKTNYILSEVPVTIQAISPSATGVHSSNRFRLDVNGFCVFEDTTHLDVKAALERSGAAEAEYLEELKVILRKRFPEYTRVEALEFVASIYLANLFSVMLSRGTKLRYRRGGNYCALRSGSETTDFPRTRTQ